MRFLLGYKNNGRPVWQDTLRQIEDKLNEKNLKEKRRKIIFGMMARASLLMRLTL